ncbi:MAG: SpoIVB peptidase [Firmicutes bacterium]|nr:SpoIVB peptidase [Bacillota bacterium]
MERAARRRLLSLLFFIFLGASIFALFLQSFVGIPSTYRVSVGEQVRFKNILPRQISSRITAYVSQDGEGMLRWREAGFKKALFCPFLDESPIAALPGQVHLEFRLFGKVPLKRVTVEVVPPVRVVPGGHSIGVLLHTQGVAVVGYAGITDSFGRKACPAREAGIAPGDLILEIEDTPVRSDAQVSFLIDRLARKKEVLRFRVKHQGVFREYRVRPIFCQETRRYRIGLYVRDGAAGVGTLTFFDPKTKRYGALGHVITDSETNQWLDLSDGKIVRATVQGIQQGQRGRIGEKVGLFLGSDATTGNIDKNTKYGIFGKLTENLKNPLFPEPVPVALGHQVREGPARLLTVLNGEKIESFAVEIQSVFPQPRPDGKAFILKITDLELLGRTGGIVQGMSGSPLIQNGRLIGAVTHVFINDPTRGYGVLIESMLEEAGLLHFKTRQVTPGLLFWSLVNSTVKNIVSGGIAREKILQRVNPIKIPGLASFCHDSKKDLVFGRRILTCRFCKSKERVTRRRKR